MGSRLKVSGESSPNSLNKAGPSNNSSGTSEVSRIPSGTEKLVKLCQKRAWGIKLWQLLTASQNRFRMSGKKGKREKKTVRTWHDGGIVTVL